MSTETENLLNKWDQNPDIKEVQVKEIEHRTHSSYKILIFMFYWNLAFTIASVVVNVYLQSIYFWAFVFWVPVAETLILLYIIGFKYDSIVAKNMRVRDFLAAYFSILFKGSCKSLNYKPFEFYVGWLWFSFLIYFATWFRPLFLFWEINGVYPIFADKSSCVFTPPTETNRGDYVYNPLGVFSAEEQFDLDIRYAHCVMFTEWASTSGELINGYLRNELGSLDCDRPQDNAFIFNQNPFSGVTCDYENFAKNLGYGIDISINAPLSNITAVPNTLCPTTTTGAVRVNGLYVAGKGQKICPTCLDYFRRENGISDNSWPPGYAHCPYLGDESINPFCWFCPTKCAKGNPQCTEDPLIESAFALVPVNRFWNPVELIGKQYQGTALGFYSALTYGQILKIYILIAIHLNMIKKFEKENNLREKKIK